MMNGKWSFRRCVYRWGCAKYRIIQYIKLLAQSNLSNHITECKRYVMWYLTIELHVILQSIEELALPWQAFSDLETWRDADKPSHKQPNFLVNHSILLDPSDFISIVRICKGEALDYPLISSSKYAYWVVMTGVPSTLITASWFGQLRQDNIPTSRRTLAATVPPPNSQLPRRVRDNQEFLNGASSWSAVHCDLV